MDERRSKRGSQWRKWDLHVHGPGTKLSDGYGVSSESWDRYCRVLHESDVQVFGITDYFSIDGYSRCVEEYRRRYPECHKVFFPNIELRTTDNVNRVQEEVNVHLLFNSDQSDCETKARDILRRLATSKTVENDRAVMAEELRTQEDYESATTPRASISEALRDVYGSSADLSDYVLILTAVNNDGMRPARGKKRKELITDELDKFSDGFFGNAGNALHFLNPGRLEDKTLTVEPKPVFSGCDAHTFEELETLLGKSVKLPDGVHRDPTWIKADLTFEGLKQTLFEPEHRVFIGPEPKIETRVRANATRYIESLTVSHLPGYTGSSGAWFDDEQIPLNKELVAIVGNKGSGKSALSDIIGLTGNTHNQKAKALRGQPETLFSFLHEQKFLKPGYAENFVSELRWYAGPPDRQSLNATTLATRPEKVEYLPQKYLERICANVEYAEFESTLNEVIFGYVPEEKQLGKANFTELIQYLSSQTDANIQDIRRQLHAANEAVAALERKLTPQYSLEIDGLLQEKAAELASHESQQPDPVPPPPESTSGSDTSALAPLETELEQLASQIRALTAQRVEQSKLLQNLEQSKTAIEREVRSMQSVRDEHADVLAQAGLSFEQIVKLSVDYEPLTEAMAAIRSRLSTISRQLATEEQINVLATDTERDSARAVSLEIRTLTLEAQRVKLVEALGKPARDYQEYLQRLSIWQKRQELLQGEEESPAPGTVRGLQAELVRIRDEYPGAVQTARDSRDAISQRVLEQKRMLTRFYDDLKGAIDTEIDRHRLELGDYQISIQAGLTFDSTFYEDFLRYIAQNRVGTFQGRDDGLVALQRLTAHVQDWQDDTQVLRFLHAVVDALHVDQREGVSGDRRRSVDKQLKDRVTVTQLYDFLFGFEYLRPRYALKVDSKDLSELSPGERGGLLLVFYLMLDRREIPLIIDQPEDNLDNRSVYEILVRFIKRAKQRRQIVIVTHNPNLAVVADAEQIIRVNIDKKNGNDFSFVSGAIEDPVINQVIVDILEGTFPAFDNRRLKYRRQKSTGIAR